MPLPRKERGGGLIYAINSSSSAAEEEEKAILDGIFMAGEERRRKYFIQSIFVLESLCVVAILLKVVEYFFLFLGALVEKTLGRQFGSTII